jgi:large subunit ribosomal protein L28
MGATEDTARRRAARPGGTAFHSGTSSQLHFAAVMSKICSVCGKKPSFGNNRSHSMVATKRRFNPNLQRIRVLVNGVAKRAYVCTRCLKAGKVVKAV